MKSFRLLPKDVGWVPYLWLIYLLNMPLILWLTGDGGPLSWSLTWLGMALFLPLYFLSFWRKGKQLLWLIAAQVVLASLIIPFSSGANVIFIFAAGALGYQRSSKLKHGLLLSMLLLVLIHAGMMVWLNDWTWVNALYVYLPIMIFGPIVYAVNVHFAERDRHNAQLRMAQGEIEHLATIAERERIARDLHDLLGHSLSLITLKSELAARLIDRDTKRAKQEIEELEQISREALQEVRSAVSGFQSKGLAAELAKAKGAIEAAGLEFNYYYENLELSPKQESLLSLVLREAVTNVIRHAKAQSCAVRLEAQGQSIVLEIEDDGKAASFGEGHGMIGMRERLRIVGGTLQITTGSRTLIRAVLHHHPEAERKQLEQGSLLSSM